MKTWFPGGFGFYISISFWRGQDKELTFDFTPFQWALGAVIDTPVCGAYWLGPFGVTFIDRSRRDKKDDSKNRPSADSSAIPRV